MEESSNSSVKSLNLPLWSTPLSGSSYRNQEVKWRLSSWIPTKIRIKCPNSWRRIQGHGRGRVFWVRSANCSGAPVCSTQSCVGHWKHTPQSWCQHQSTLYVYVELYFPGHFYFYKLRLHGNSKSHAGPFTRCHFPYPSPTKKKFIHVLMHIRSAWVIWN